MLNCQRREVSVRNNIGLHANLFGVWGVRRSMDEAEISEQESEKRSETREILKSLTG
jgi:hypothetical protein